MSEKFTSVCVTFQRCKGFSPLTEYSCNFFGEFRTLSHDFAELVETVRTLEAESKLKEL